MGYEGCPHSAGVSNQGVRHGLGTTVTHAWSSASSRSLPTPHPLPGRPRDPGLVWGGIHFLTGKARLCSPCLVDTGGWVALWAGPESSLLSFPLQGQNPFELAFSLDQTHHGETDFSLECPARPGEGLRGRGASPAAGEGRAGPGSHRGRCLLSRAGLTAGSPSTDMPTSQPIDIPDAKKRGKKKKRCRATDSFSGRFEGEWGPAGAGEEGGWGWPGAALTAPLLHRRLPATGGCARGGRPRPSADLCQPHH